MKCSNENENKIEVLARPEEEKPNLKEDYKNLVIIFLFYVLQGVPMGMTSSMTVLLQNRGASYADQTLFSIAGYPFMLKIFWAPIVDCFYCKAFGRRKTWLVPSQLLIGISLFYLSGKVDGWFGDGSTQKPQVLLITVVFSLVWFLTATQDIAVDGWAITMLQRKNVGYAATVNFIGQSFGSLLGFIVFLSLESKEFCNKYIFSEPRDEGLVKLSGFLVFWGIAYLTITLGVGIFKREASVNEALHPNHGIKKAYPTLWKIFKLKPMLRIGSIFSTEDFSFSACELITTLKLIDYGISKDTIALYNVPTFVVQLLIPIVIGKYTAGKFPMTFYLKAFPYRLVLSIVVVVFVFFTPMMIDKEIPAFYSAVIMTIFFFHQTAMRCMFVSSMAFFAKVSDPSMSGTYMTAYDVIYLGGKIFYTFSLWLVDLLTWKSCEAEGSNFVNATISVNFNTCSNEGFTEECVKNGGNCKIIVDGYYIVAVLNSLFGIFWFLHSKKHVKHLENLPIEAWHVNFLEKPAEAFPLT